MSKLRSIKSPSLSVVLSTYNAGYEIIDAVNSIVSQTLMPNEIIIVDDGSNEFSKKILKKLLDKYNYQKRIKLIVNIKNIGLTNSLIKGVNKSTSQLIARIDADDVWHNTHLENSVKALVNSDASLVGGNSYLYPLKKNFYISKKINYKVIRNKFILNPYIHSSVVFKKTIYDSIGQYDPSYKFSQDYDLWIRFLLSGNKIIKLTKATVYTRVLSSSISEKYKYQQMVDSIRSIIQNYGISPFSIMGLSTRIFIYLVGALRRNLF